jgi:hypothetical protein
MCSIDQSVCAACGSLEYDALSGHSRCVHNNQHPDVGDASATTKPHYLRHLYSGNMPYRAARSERRRESGFPALLVMRVLSGDQDAGSEQVAPGPPIHRPLDHLHWLDRMPRSTQPVRRAILREYRLRPSPPC